MSGSLQQALGISLLNCISGCGELDVAARDRCEPKRLERGEGLL